MFEYLKEQEKTYVQSYVQSVADHIISRGATKVTIEVDDCIEIRAEGQFTDIYFLYHIDDIKEFKRALIAATFTRASIKFADFSSIEVFAIQKG